jgi:hypothetical protein
MSDVTTSVDVRVPVRTAYNQWTQFESFPEFMSGVVSVRQLDDRRTHWVTEVAGARREFDAEIVEQLPDERIAWRSTDGDVRHSGMVTFQPIADDQTRVTVDMAWEPEGMMEKAGGALGVDRLQVKADLERFRRFIEDRGTETGEWRGAVAGATATADPNATTAVTDTSALADTRPMTGPADVTSTTDTIDLTDTTAAPGMTGTGTGVTGAAGPGAMPAGTAEMPVGAQAPASYEGPHDDVVDILMAQHAQVKELMERTSAAEGPEKQRLFAELVELLKVHEKGEQRVVHPVTRSSVAGGAQTANARLGEEQRADQLIAEVEDLSMNGYEFDVWFEQLKRAVLTHAEHEEREEFPMLRRELAPERLRTMAEELVAAQTAHN